MKAQNISQIRNAYLCFAISVISTAFLGVLSIYCFINTATAELELIGSKTREYDKINAYQIELVGRMDTLYNYMQMLNTSEKINDVLLLNMISNKKMNYLNSLDKLPKEDSYLFRKIGNQINVFLNVDDSIRQLIIEEDLVKSDLIRCIEDNKQLARKLSIGGILNE
ncbi:hypothetical protein [Saccharicrinis aurantiacus]|uniref:hypothetical protein n=1 Tax=Saccharicrinis aurantiacus TaxID=1849719 RepID=UPI0024933F07|nr:hypothetical protein [Saccharicrinis aurantiacus]